jgi:hypothetical protein
MKKMRKISFIILIVTYLTLLFGCSEGKYADSSNWNVTDEVFSSQYFELYMNGIEAIAEKYHINGITSEMNTDGKGFIIYCSDEDELIQFSFYNTVSGYGNYRSYYYAFRTNREDLFHYSNYLSNIAFISEVNEFVSFDYQGDTDTYQKLYVGYLEDKSNTYYFHYDSVVGNLGYLVTWGDHFSETESRWYISFEFHGLLKTNPE